MGQELNGSLGSWVTLSGPFPALLWPHLLGSSNFSELQSAYRKGHSTKTGLLASPGQSFTAANDKQVTVLIGLDLFTAFDTVDHRLLLDRLRRV